MAEFHDISVKEVRKETNDCASVKLTIPEHLQDEFAYRQGQHIIFRKYIDGEEIRRTYSLCSNPYDNEWRVCVKQIPEGKFSTYVNRELKAGDVVEVMAPTGKFGVETQVEPKKKKHYLFFAAGSGITPILSLVKTFLQQEPQSTCQLFYLNRTTKSIIFREELEQLRNRYFGRFELAYFLTREHRDIELFNGRLDAAKIKALTETLIDIDKVTGCFVCGPEDLTFLLRDELVKYGLPKNRMHYELFVTGLSEADKKRAAAALENRFDGTKITVLDGGKEFKFAMSEDYDNVLDAALAAGADVPFACKGGVCSTCKCQVKEGAVEMKKNYALEKDELDKNIVLSCQAVPTTETLVVDFDI